MLCRYEVQRYLLPNLVNRKDIWMIKRRGCLCLLLEASQPIFKSCEITSQQFKRNFPAERCVLTQEHFTHTTSADKTKHFIVADLFALDWTGLYSRKHFVSC